ncbi:MAG TPA: 16S rRNA (guanine(966)-N(2))-methyltransferase RsmD [Pyrinomonadaceae bacterium]|nr:16S rRNA (guanine(966)-N(2))-methyltransferase RsmD [Pyrinomonadaceae bacterium]
MRIIAGRYKGRNLKSPPSTETRPTSDRLRETLFNVISPLLGGARFLDLCAGSGAVGIEALSRGAGHSTFVDRSREMSILIGTNLKLCRIEPTDFAIVTADAIDFLRKQFKTCSPGWDLIYFDPLYADDHLAVLEALGGFAHALINEAGVLIVEHHHKTALPESCGAIERYRILKQGESSLSFYSNNQQSIV